MTNRIVISGPRSRFPKTEGFETILTTSNSTTWSKGLSPFYLGPCKLWGEHQALKMENAWQYSKVYREHVGPDGMPTNDWFVWAQMGWNQDFAKRYPMGKGTRPAYSYWDGKRYSYVDARIKIYFPLYRNAVKETQAWRMLKAVHERTNLNLWDYDGYNEELESMTLADALQDGSRPMGHAFILKAMLLHGEDITAKHLIENNL